MTQLWRFNDSKVVLVVRGNPRLVSALIKATGAVNQCVSGHEFQCLLPLADLHRYQRLLGLSAAGITQLERASWSGKNPVVAA